MVQPLIAALNTNTAPDILFNDNTRIVSIQQTTGKLSDLKPEVDAAAADKSFLTEGDWTARPSRIASCRSRFSAP